jgi:hypothetical protein
LQTAIRHEEDEAAHPDQGNHWRTMDGIVNQTFSMPAENKDVSSANKGTECSTKKKTSPWMFLSLTTHSLGIIFGDM